MSGRCGAAENAGKPLDVISFKNGDRLSGTLVSADGNSVSFTASVTGKVDLQWSDIARIQLASPVTISHSLANGKSSTERFDNPLITVQGGNLTAESAENHLTISSSQLLSIGEPAAFVHWSGQIKGQTSLTTSTQNQYVIGATLHTAFETKNQKALAHQITSLTAQANYSEGRKPNASPVITALDEGLIQHNLYLVDNESLDNYPSPYDSFYLFGLADLYHNFSLGMNLEQAYGVGAAWDRTLRGRTTQLFGVALDFRFVRENLHSPGGTINLAAAGPSEHYSITIPLVSSKKPISIGESIHVIPAFNNGHALQARGIASLSFPLTPRLSFGPQEVDDYLRNSPPGSKPNYSQFQLTFSYDLGPLTK